MSQTWSTTDLDGAVSLFAAEAEPAGAEPAAPAGAEPAEGEVAAPGPSTGPDARPADPVAAGGSGERRARSSPTISPQ